MGHAGGRPSHEHEERCRAVFSGRASVSPDPNLWGRRAVFGGGERFGSFLSFRAFGEWRMENGHAGGGPFRGHELRCRAGGVVLVTEGDFDGAGVFD
jgi:hypothetical protein